jgi:hypothetical protein
VGLERIVNGGYGQARIFAEPPEIGRLAAVPAVIHQNLDSVKAGLGGQLKDTGDAIGKE